MHKDYMIGRYYVNGSTVCGLVVPCQMPEFDRTLRRKIKYAYLPSNDTIAKAMLRDLYLLFKVKHFKR